MNSIVIEWKYYIKCPIYFIPNITLNLTIIIYIMDNNSWIIIVKHLKLKKGVCKSFFWIGGNQFWHTLHQFSQILIIENWPIWSFNWNNSLFDWIEKQIQLIGMGKYISQNNIASFPYSHIVGESWNKWIFYYKFNLILYY